MVYGFINKPDHQSMMREVNSDEIFREIDIVCSFWDILRFLRFSGRFEDFGEFLGD